MFCKKTDAEGNVTEEKAQLCVRGFRQIKDVDFHETFAPMGCLATLRFLLGYCASNSFDIQQMDVKTAFLHGDLDKDIFIRVPEGYVPTMRGDDEITSAFNMKDPGDLEYVLGMKVTRNKSMKTFSLSQELYINSLLNDFGMQYCKPVSTPLVPSSRLNPFSNEEANPASINYGRAVGLLNYLVSCTRPDITFAAYCLA
ncbi:hypothetical protein O181_045032 [Austropuccinia psidii MF-1]|uniref:Reverse transcriptase Ty1/copia-type domain-containing protein n=1 Tax=Austropuccinia psidii MF-1 TaxID=1389203 RepID=A0A9Q3HIC6_9BASI|nr:hypothetical protein [Austropuccinia psidii MF-1]